MHLVCGQRLGHLVAVAPFLQGVLQCKCAAQIGVCLGVVAPLGCRLRLEAQFFAVCLLYGVLALALVDELVCVEHPVVHAQFAQCYHENGVGVVGGGYLQRVEEGEGAERVVPAPRLGIGIRHVGVHLRAVELYGLHELGAVLLPFRRQSGYLFRMARHVVEAVHHVLAYGQEISLPAGLVECCGFQFRHDDIAVAVAPFGSSVE